MDMFESKQMDLIRARVERVTGIALPYEIKVNEGDGLAVMLENGKAVISAQDYNALARGYFLLCRCAREGKAALDIYQKRHFASCGAMVDCSRGAVMKPEAVRRCIDQLA